MSQEMSTLGSSCFEREVYPRVLIAEDDADSRTFYSIALQHCQLRVDLVSSGTVALERYCEAREAGNPYHLLVLDVNLGNSLSGPEVILKIRELGDKQIKAIYLTAYSDNVIALSKGYCNVLETIHKPVLPEVLIETIYRVLAIPVDVAEHGERRKRDLMNSTAEPELKTPSSQSRQVRFLKWNSIRPSSFSSQTAQGIAIAILAALVVAVIWRQSTVTIPKIEAIEKKSGNHLTVKPVPIIGPIELHAYIPNTQAALPEPLKRTGEQDLTLRFNASDAAAVRKFGSVRNRRVRLVLEWEN